jgi:nucleotide-binding universal stress UspA family protein
MFKRILIPTDGSELSALAVEKGLDLAKEMGAEVTALHVGTEFHFAGFNRSELARSLDEYEALVNRRGKEILGEVERAAKDRGVRCKTSFSTGDQPYEDIIKAAVDNGCDLILMASHGRRGVKAVLLGSETQKVLTHSAIPVLVYRTAQPG